MAEPVRGESLDALAAVLRTTALPADDLSLPGRTFFHFHDDAGPVGWGGYELLADAALLRSIVIAPERRGCGLGREVVGELVERAAGLGARTAYLLTETATGFFEALGFDVVDRALAPPLITETRQARELCPASAHLMRKDIRP